MTFSRRRTRILDRAGAPSVNGAAPGALVIAKIVYPETQESQTMGTVKLEVKSDYSNVIDAVSHGAGDGFKIAMNVIAMLMTMTATST